MKTMRNILHLIETSEPGGAETVLAQIASNLTGERYRSLVCVLEKGWLTDHLDELGITYTMIENKRSYDPVFLHRLVRLIRQHEIDLVHSHEFMMTVYGSIAASLTRKPMIATIHGKVYYPDKKRRVRLLKLAFFLSSTMVTVSEDLRCFLADIMNVDSKEMMTLYNGIDLRRYSTTRTKDESRRLLSIRPDSLVAITVGSLFEVKGLPYLLDAAKELASRFTNFTLLIVGEGNQEEVLKEKCRTLSLDDTVQFLGFRRDVPELLNAADVYVCSSLSEGHSLSILEAMAMSLPVVATDVGGNPELIIPDQNGYLVHSQDPEGLAEAISTLLRNLDQRIRMGKTSRKMVEQKYKLEIMIRNYENLYEKVLKR